MPVTRHALVLCPMPSERRPLDRRLARAGLPQTLEVSVALTGIGPAKARAATRRALDGRPADVVIVCGIAGGLAPVSHVGDLVVPAEALDRSTGRRVAATAAGGATLHGTIRTTADVDYEMTDADVAALVAAGIVAVDMETATIGEVCAERGVPWLAFRAISDMAGDGSLDPEVLTLVDADGRPKPVAAMRYLARHPSKILTLVRTGRDASRAAVIAADATVACLRRIAATADG